MNMKKFLESLSIYTKYFDEEQSNFYNQLIEQQDKAEAKKFTENGKKILKAMRDNYDQYLNVFSSKQLGEILFMPPRSVSGSMKKLLAEGYTEKKSQNPVTYGLTELGKTVEFES